MTTIENKPYWTKEEAVAECKAFAAANPGHTVHNFPFYKLVRRETTETERNASRMKWGCTPITVTVLQFCKVTADDARRIPGTKGLYEKIR